MRLRRLTDKDIAQMEAWLKEAHVSKWFEHPEAWIHEITLRNTKYSFITHLIAEENGRPIGFCQYYDYSRGGEDWNGSIPSEGSYSIDYLIGEKDALGKGFGKAIVRQLVEEIAKYTNARRVIVQPEPENTASRSTLLSAGFQYDKKNDLFLLLLESEKNGKDCL